MREILFRGKRLDTGEWVYWTGLGRFTVPQRGKLISGKEGLTDWAYELLTDPNTVGQYTGVTDKNGKRIFEGDILSSEIVWDDDDEVTIEIDTVIWCRNGWYTQYEDCLPCPMDEKERLPVSEVIGNIHDNPELLEKEADK